MTVRFAEGDGSYDETGVEIKLKDRVLLNETPPASAFTR